MNEYRPLETQADVRARFRDSKCYACASKENNPLGLHLEFEKTQRGALTHFRLTPLHESYPGFIHGGIISTILDETMGYACLLHWHKLPFTRNLEVQFIKPLSAGKEYVCESELSVPNAASEYELTAHIRDLDAKLCASGRGRFFIPSSLLARLMSDQIDPKEFVGFFWDET